MMFEPLSIIGQFTESAETGTVHKEPDVQILFAKGFAELLQGLSVTQVYGCEADMGLELVSDPL